MFDPGLSLFCQVLKLIFQAPPEILVIGLDEGSMMKARTGPKHCLEEEKMKKEKEQKN